MKTVFIRNTEYVCDENSSGRPHEARLPCNIYLAAAYCAGKGRDVDVLSVGENGREFDVDPYDVVAVWVPLLEGFDVHLEYVRAAKAAGKRTIVILNDPYEQLEHELMDREEAVDVVIRLYERELVIEKVLGEFERDIHCRKFDFPGVLYRTESGEILDTGKQPFLHDLHHLVSSAEYLKKVDLSAYKQAFVEISRGCPYQCGFCFYNNTGHRKRRIEDIIDELKVLVHGNFEHIWLHDLNMLVDTKFCAKLCEAIIENGLEFTWGTDGRLEICKNEELMTLLRRAGCKRMAFGFETTNPEALKQLKKGKNLEDFDEAVRLCRQADIIADMNYMIGFPWDTRETLAEMELHSQRFDISCVQFVRPLRGTPLYDQYRELGLFEGELGLDAYVDCRVAPMFPTLHVSKEYLMQVKDRFGYTPWQYRVVLLKRKLKKMAAVLGVGS
ncbi:B12-binding domain-containing radical SAM protein [Salidesulfovibrio onnuriiensis]|uniref:B12-binding domain-containing radical SAM protein n=1 Tax=Salidesulfovibrio onnuriiensis TaxID=2583823 RepID=UPI0011C7C6DB|nr:radical SAM protein [Salidesulfovibrio onnuriiensis]